MKLKIKVKLVKFPICLFNLVGGIMPDVLVFSANLRVKMFEDYEKLMLYFVNYLCYPFLQ